MKDKLETQMKEMQTATDDFGKKLHYLETTAKNSQNHIEAMLKRGGS